MSTPVSDSEHEEIDMWNAGFKTEELSTSTRLEEIRASIEAESVSMSELVELRDLADAIDLGDTVLLEWAGVPEHSEDSEDEQEVLAVIEILRSIACSTFLTTVESDWINAAADLLLDAVDRDEYQAREA